MADNMEICKQWGDNPSFKKRLADMVFSVTYNADGEPFQGQAIV
jgi:type I restriction enzyme R subunit